MKVLHTRQDLIDLVAASPPTKAIGTAITRGTVEILGAFKAENETPFYLLRVTSERKAVWIVQVMVLESQGRYTVGVLGEVPWSRWAGSWSQRRCLIDGDFPANYGYCRMLARKK